VDILGFCYACQQQQERLKDWSLARDAVAARSYTSLKKRKDRTTSWRESNRDTRKTEKQRETTKLGSDDLERIEKKRKRHGETERVLEWDNRGEGGGEEGARQKKRKTEEVQIGESERSSQKCNVEPVPQASRKNGFNDVC